ncbi:thiol reductant ABC exporter subunit CydC [Actinoplanes sp. NEAU-A12]|uniref:Thiol reductant ABC exporter subunit CydC n=1 Tax=Actinoplanes sandaracinus TaxID=3045177 RepID=A0ABT6WZ36_9ACTN|nr:thiol reductant ABC exporter subunit CydC [Actinoplanes sandaracinus]MDI6104870.1 thiol reductant ABC exporter subunit CydC [Actinoplanes sandaracinus]
MRYARASRGGIALLSLIGIGQAAATIAIAVALCGIVTGMVAGAAGTDGAAGTLGGAVGGALGGTFAWAIVLLAGAFAARAGLAWGEQVVAQRTAARVTDELRRSLLDRVVGRGPAWVASYGAGRLTTVLGTGLDALRPWFSGYLPALILGVLLPPLVVVIMAVVDPASAVVTLVTLPLIPVLGALIGWATKARAERRWAADARLAGHFLDVVRGLSTLRMYGRAERQIDVIADLTDRHRRATLRVLRVAFLSSTALDLVGTLSVGLIAVQAGLRVAAGSMELGPALLVILLAPEAYRPLREMAARYHASTDAGAVIADVDEILTDRDGFTTRGAGHAITSDRSTGSDTRIGIAGDRSTGSDTRIGIAGDRFASQDARRDLDYHHLADHRTHDDLNYHHLTQGDPDFHHLTHHRTQGDVGHHLTDHKSLDDLDDDRHTHHHARGELDDPTHHQARGELDDRRSRDHAIDDLGDDGLTRTAGTRPRYGRRTGTARFESGLRRLRAAHHAGQSRSSGDGAGVRYEPAALVWDDEIAWDPDGLLAGGAVGSSFAFTSAAAGQWGVRAAGLRARYPGATEDALSLDSLSVRAGELVALRGPSGAGKTTALRVLAGLHPAEAGAIAVGSAFHLPQRPALPHARTVAEAFPVGTTAAEVDAALHTVGLAREVTAATPLGEQVAGVSAGQRQRLALAVLLHRAGRAVAERRTRDTAPVVTLLLDEPTAHLDSAAERLVIDRLREFAALGCAVLVVAHRPALLAAADRITHLRPPTGTALPTAVTHTARMPEPPTHTTHTFKPSVSTVNTPPPPTNTTGRPATPTNTTGATPPLTNTTDTPPPLASTADTSAPLDSATDTPEALVRAAGMPGAPGWPRGFSGATAEPAVAPACPPPNAVTATAGHAGELASWLMVPAVAHAGAAVTLPAPDDAEDGRHAMRVADHTASPDRPRTSTAGPVRPRAGTTGPAGGAPDGTGHPGGASVEGTGSRWSGRLRKPWVAAGLGAGSSLAGILLTGAAAWLLVRASSMPPVLSLSAAVVLVRGSAVARPLLRYLERLVSHDVAFARLGGRRAKVYADLIPHVPGPGLHRRGDLLTRLVDDVDATTDGLLRGRLPAVSAAVTAGVCLVVVAGTAPAVAVPLTVGLLVAGVLAPAVAAWQAARQEAATGVARAALRDAVVETVDGVEELAGGGGRPGVPPERSRTLANLEARAAREAGLASAIAHLGWGVAAAGAAVVLVRGGLPAEWSAVLLLGVIVLGETVVALPEAAIARRRAAGAERRVATLTTDRSPAIRRPGHGAAGPAEVRRPDHDATSADGRRAGHRSDDRASAAARVRGGGSGAVVACGLTAGWDPGRTPVLDGLELRLPAGSRTAIMGRSGCGKSTLAAVLAGLLTPRAGTVEVSGTAVLVGEETGHVFASTVRENLRLAAPAATDPQLLAVLRRVGLDGMDLETWLGTGGSTVSGGQRRRLATARALLADPALLILDEPTEGIDEAGARELMADLLDAASGRTVLVLAHRAEGLDLVDRVLDLEKGRLEDRASR